MQEEQKRLQEASPSPPFALYKIKRDQYVLSGSVLLLGLFAAFILHGGPGGFFTAILVTFIISALSDEILDVIVPGRYAHRVGTGEIIEYIAPAASVRPKSTAIRLFQTIAARRRAGTIVEEEEKAEQQPEDAPASSPASPEVTAQPASQSGTLMPPLPGAPQRLFPFYGEKETLRLGRVAATGQRFDPHFNDLLGKGIISSAVMGSGKSMANGLIVERAALAGMPAVVLDHKGEYASITELNFAKGLRAGADASFDFQLTEERADAFVRLVIDGRYQAIVDLPSYGLSWIVRARIVSAVGKALMAYSAQRQRRGLPPGEYQISPFGGKGQSGCLERFE